MTEQDEAELARLLAEFEERFASHFFPALLALTRVAEVLD